MGWGWVGGPCDFSVSPSPFGLDFGTLDFGLWDFGLGLDNINMKLLTLNRWLSEELTYFYNRIEIKSYILPDKGKTIMFETFWKI